MCDCTKSFGTWTDADKVILRRELKDEPTPEFIDSVCKAITRRYVCVRQGFPQGGMTKDGAVNARGVVASVRRDLGVEYVESTITVLTAAADRLQIPIVL